MGCIRWPAWSLVAASVLAAPIGEAAAAGQDRIDAPRPHARGQSVTPSFEGWYPNDDGTYSLLFGYFNRNYEEHLDIPVGPDNRMEPGPADRGQPTHFLPRRQTGVFTVVVPEDFGDQELTWFLTAYGETHAIPGFLRREWQIDALKERANGNTPPVLSWEEGGPIGQGPGGLQTTLSARVGEPTALALWTRDDGVRRAQGGLPSEPGVRWSKYRGRGSVSFDDPEPAIDPHGEARTGVTFGEPGEYVLRVLAWDESGAQHWVMAGGFFCCWTNGFVTVTVR